MRGRTLDQPPLTEGLGEGVHMKHGQPTVEAEDQALAQQRANILGNTMGVRGTRQGPEEFAFQSPWQGGGNDAQPMYSREGSSKTSTMRST
jgi:hypothetical protein